MTVVRQRVMWNSDGTNDDDSLWETGAETLLLIHPRIRNTVGDTAIWPRAVHCTSYLSRCNTTTAEKEYETITRSTSCPCAMNETRKEAEDVGRICTVCLYVNTIGYTVKHNESDSRANTAESNTVIQNNRADTADAMRSHIRFLSLWILIIFGSAPKASPEWWEVQQPRRSVRQRNMSY